MSNSWLIAICGLAAAASPSLAAPPFASAGPRTEPFQPSAYAQVRYVSTAGSDSADGSRAHPWRTPAHAITTVAATAQRRAAILIAAGTYTGATLTLRPGVDLLGGFDPASWTRDIQLHRTILDGENQRRIVTGAVHARLDGFVLRNGRVRGQGAAILADGTSPEIFNNIFEANSTLAPAGWKPAEKHETANDGGAIAVLHDGAPHIGHNLFLRNATEAGRGAAIACVQSAPQIEGNVFLANTAGTADPARSSDGGAISAFDHSSPVIAANIVAGNRTQGQNDGGGIFIALWSSATVRGNAILGSWGDDDGGALFIGGQQHHYSTPLDPIPPESAYLVRLDDNWIAGNDNRSHNAGVARATMQSRVEMSGNIAFDNVGGLKIETSAAALRGNILAGPLTITNTSKSSKVLPGPVVLNGDIVAGPLDLEMQADIHRSCGPGLPSGGGNVESAPQFVDDGIQGHIRGVRHGDFTSTLSVDAPLTPGALAGRILHIGDTWTVVRSNTANAVEVWGAVPGSAAAFQIAPTYRVRPGTPCAKLLSTVQK